MEHTVVASNGSPTRALAFGSAANPSASARALPGIPHHKAVCYGCDTQASTALQALGYLHLASPLLTRLLTWFLSLKVQAPELHVALEDWHCRAEAACQAAVSMGLASLSKPG